ncbi:MAG: ligase-associated DNA damage response DEXH box helicase [Akkermansiaceae bacterium]
MPVTPLVPFFKEQGWLPFPFQKETWQAYHDGKSGLLHAPTGLGKTLAVWGGPVEEALEAKPADRKGCRVLWITPLRALAQDTQKSLQEPLDALGLKLEVGTRTGDSSSYQKAKLRKKLPFCLISTPESLSLFLTHDNFRENLSGLTTVIIDEWHELIGTKRGVQTELCLARLRKWFPELRIWGLSATLGNTEEAMRVLLGSEAKNGVTISGMRPKKILVQTILPKSIDRFPWSGHIGTSLLKPVIKKLEKGGTTLLFTNTRSQTEIWFQDLLEAKPDWKDEIAMHHGSLNQEERKLVEERLRAGTIRCVICTSSLDLGVDFSPVTQVIQVGSPKGIARLLQRAGRSGHAPGKTSKLFCVPSNALELAEFAAARDAIATRDIEARHPLQKPLDVLVQHLVTTCIGEPTSADALRTEIQSSYAYRQLTDEEWHWTLEFITVGGKALANYPAYRKVETIDGKLTIPATQKRLIQMHRLSIGTITSHPMVSIIQSGKNLGTVEEGFISKIKPGGVFIFGGRRLQLVKFQRAKATVKKATKKAKGSIPTWVGARMPLSSELAHAVSKRFKSGDFDTPELQKMKPLLALQQQWSHLPHDGMILLEHVTIRDEAHLFCHTFAGRLVNEGLGALSAYRITHDASLLIQVTANDYGFSLSSTSPLPFDEPSWRELLTTENLTNDLLDCMNTAELARRQFRDIARVSGLILQQLPNKRSPQKDLQTSSSLLYEVFSRYDPDNLLLEQARREILDTQLELTRLKATLDDLKNRPLHLQQLKRLSPLAFPLWADRLRAQFLGDDAAARLEKMLTSLENAAG